jgi:hypothetical protein
MVKFDERTKKKFLFCSAAAFLIREDVTTHKYKTFLEFFLYFQKMLKYICFL